MTLNEVALSLLWTAFLLAAVPRMRRYWSGEPPADLERALRRIWPYSEAALQGWLRAQTAMYIGAWFLLFAYLSAVLHPSAAQSTRPILAWIVPAAFAGVVVMVAMAASIVLFNVPKRLVFPALREQEGLLIRWWRVRRGRPPADDRSRLT